MIDRRRALIGTSKIPYNALYWLGNEVTVKTGGWVGTRSSLSYWDQISRRGRFERAKQSLKLICDSTNMIKSQAIIPALPIELTGYTKVVAEFEQSGYGTATVRLSRCGIQLVESDIFGDYSGKMITAHEQTQLTVNISGSPRYVVFWATKETFDAPEYTVDIKKIWLE